VRVNILLVEDDDAVAARILRCLASAGHAMRWCVKPSALLPEIATHAASLVLIGRPAAPAQAAMLIEAIRAEGSSLPILLLTASDDVEERVAGLRAGADDCLGRSFDPDELAARIEALGRRAPAIAEATMLRAQDIEMDLLRREVARGGQPIDLQPREFSVLEQLLRHGDRVVSKAMLLERAWNYDFDPGTNVVETQVSRLRAKLNQGFAEDAIQTVRGAGYRIRLSA
jgi:two-component system, OmpR family, response regulator